MMSQSKAKMVKSADQPQYFTKLASSIAQGSRSSLNKGGTSTGGINRLGYNSVLEYSHPPLPEEPAGLYDTLITDSDMALTKKKFVKVSSYGEIEINPDIVEFCIKITTSRKDPVEAKESVKKRKDFVLTALKKYGVPEANILVSVIVKRTPIAHGNLDDLFLQEAQEDLLKPLKLAKKENEQDLNNDNPTKDELDKVLIYFEEICVTCNSLVQYLKVFSICNEKLDRHVEVSRPVVRFSSTHLQSCTKSAVRQAMAHGIQKANEMISSLKPRASLGRLYYSVEDSLQVEPVENYESSDGFETFTWKRLNKLVRCTLTSVFELDHPKIKKLI